LLVFDGISNRQFARNVLSQVRVAP
jgi:hypothetical protein